MSSHMSASHSQPKRQRKLRDGDSAAAAAGEETKEASKKTEGLRQTTMAGWLKTKSCSDSALGSEEAKTPLLISTPTRSFVASAAPAVPSDVPGARAAAGEADDVALGTSSTALAGPFSASSGPPDMAGLPSLRLKGTTRMEVRGRHRKQDPCDSSEQDANSGTVFSSSKRTKVETELLGGSGGNGGAIMIEESEEEAPMKSAPKPKPSLGQELVPPWCRTLRISAGRAAAAAGIHCYADVGEMFLEFLYQDLPELFLEDAALAGVEVVSPAAERARLLDKSGEVELLDQTLRDAATAPGIEGALSAREAVGATVAKAERAGRLTAEEAKELRSTLELEINLEFGTRHEDSALEVYEQRMGTKVYGAQHRVSVPMPADGPQAALSQAFPVPHTGVRPRDGDGVSSGDHGSRSDSKVAGNSSSIDSNLRGPQPFFRLTGFVDGLVDVQRGSPAPPNNGNPPRAGGIAFSSMHMTGAVHAGAATSETLVVEVKHRMGRIKDPPDIYDVVQLCSYCRALGCTRGDLVQCLRTRGADGKGAAASKQQLEKLHVTRIDFSEGSPDRRGWDEHVLPGLYAVAAAVYAARRDQTLRLRLLAASNPEERVRMVAELLPHLGR
mmetsp:Transcript_65599/g.118175  ORF Transcript_65599/g.118175 Transcript_65599/m.118175 type:complete len:614 (+) Transcript_65599:72-1913(+)